jgi:microcystin-dependent protein
MDAFLGEIRIFPFSFAPKGWALCNGQTLPIIQNEALFSVIQNAYGGDGKTNFRLPNLQGSVPIHAGHGTGPGLSPYKAGQTGGEQSHTLLAAEMPAHHHVLAGDTGAASSANPSNGVYRAGDYPGGAVWAYNPERFGNETPLKAAAITSTGGNKGHNNMMPSLTMSFCIALQGIMPLPR